MTEISDIEFLNRYREHERVLEDMRREDPEKAAMCELITTLCADITDMENRLMEANAALRKQIYPTNAQQLMETLGLDIGMKTKDFKRAVIDFKKELEAKDDEIKQLKKEIEKLELLKMLDGTNNLAEEEPPECGGTFFPYP